jgi:hypothetical protein
MRLLLAVLAAFFVFAVPARAASPALGIADDRVLLQGGPQADQAVAEWKQLGVQEVRIYALWNRIAPDSPSGANNWAQLDGAVSHVVSAGMKPILTITGPGPLWVSRRSERGDPRYQPDPKLFRTFARQVAERYAPFVDRYIIWNEPNLSGWLRPEASCRKHRCTPVAPNIYRSLVRGAYPVIHAADPKAQVLIGAMSSRGSTLHSENSNMHPLAFLRGLGCVNKKFHRIKSGGCKRFKTVPADGFAFHPHGVLLAPEKSFPNKDDVSISSLSRLTRVLDKLRKMKRIKSAHRLNLYLDEFGYQTNPPDKFAGITLRQQDSWLQRAAYQAWRNPRVKLFSQYLWKDEPRSLNDQFGGWQSGLRFSNLKAKPSLKHFPDPFVMDPARKRLWGQVRRRDSKTVQVQRKLTKKSKWRKVATRKTDANGYWSWKTKLIKGASYRFRAATATSATLKRK